MDLSKVSISFPLFDDKEAGETFRKDSIALSKVMCDSVNAFLEQKGATDPDNMPSAMSIGAACYIVSHLFGLTFDDERKEQVAKGLMGTLIANHDDALTLLAMSPPPNKLS